jgi:hypothetical protein
MLRDTHLVDDLSAQVLVCQAFAADRASTVLPHPLGNVGCRAHLAMLAVGCWPVEARMTTREACAVITCHAPRHNSSDMFHNRIFQTEEIHVVILRFAAPRRDEADVPSQMRSRQSVHSTGCCSSRKRCASVQAVLRSFHDLSCDTWTSAILARSCRSMPP